jgi:hypothetical protein
MNKVEAPPVAWFLSTLTFYAYPSTLNTSHILLAMCL